MHRIEDAKTTHETAGVKSRQLVQSQRGNAFQPGTSKFALTRVDENVRRKQGFRNDRSNVGNNYFTEGPTRPVSKSTGRFFRTGRSPKGNSAIQISLGLIQRLDVVDGIDVLARIRQIVGPFGGNQALPLITCLVFLRYKNDQSDLADGQIAGDLCTQIVLLIDVAK